MLFHSVRARLAGWHTLVLALVLAAFFVGSRAFLVDLTRQRTDELLRETARAFVHMFSVEAEGTSSVHEAARRSAREFRFSAYRVLVYSENHQLVAVSDSTDVVPGLGVDELTKSPVAPLHHLLTPASLGAPSFGTLRVPGRVMRAYAVEVSIDSTPFVIATLELQGSEGESVAAFVRSAGIAIPFALVLAGFGGYFLARKSLAPVAAMSDQAMRISSQNLNERLSVRTPGDELGRLASAFNDLLARLEQSFERQRQFMADASHELRTPVSVLVAETDIALLHPGRETSDYQQSLEVVQREAYRMKHAVEDLFTLARADAGDRPLMEENFFLEELATDCVQGLRNYAKLKGVTLGYTPHLEAPFKGDAEVVGRLVLNLLDNAITHTPAGGRVELTLDLEAEVYRIAVRDTGTGIPTEDQPHIFRRFYRAGNGRPQAELPVRHGAGLGLAIAKWAAEVHGGNLELMSSGPEGTVFHAVLPVPATARAEPGT